MLAATVSGTFHWAQNPEGKMLLCMFMLLNSDVFSFHTFTELLIIVYSTPDVFIGMFC